MKPKSYRILLKSIVLALLFGALIQTFQYLLPGPLLGQLMDSGLPGQTLVFILTFAEFLFFWFLGMCTFTFINALLPDNKVFFVTSKSSVKA